MTRFGILGATALTLSLAIATPVLAQQAPGSKAGAHAANMGGARMGGGPRMQSNFRGGQANVGRANFAGRGNAQFVPRGNAQFAQRGEFRGDRGRGFGRDAGFAVAAGVATGAAIASGGYGYGYSDPYYGDNYAYDPNYAGDGYDNSYAYDNGATFNSGLPLVTFGQQAPVDQTTVAMGGDASYCAQRYRSYDPASGTYLGYDGLRHPCQ
jgi:BA14K-like protein